jgi:hypothetical protein
MQKSPPSEPHFTEIEFLCKIPKGTQSRLIVLILWLGTIATAVAFTIYGISKLF